MFRTALTRIPTSTMKARCLSTQGESAVRKFQEAMNEYRLEHYSYETPHRFRREVIKAATKGSDVTDKIVFSSMQQVLYNIGAQDKVSSEDLKTIFSELGDGSGDIATERMVQIL